MIYGCELGAIRSRSMFVLKLNIRRLDVLFSCGPLFLGALSRAHAAIAPVIAHAGRTVIVIGDPGVVGIVNDRHIDVVHRAIVSEAATFPASPEIANSHVTKAIIYAAIESDVRPPITSMPVIAAVPPTPVAWSPKYANAGSQYPSARHPIIIIVAISPIAGRPDIALPRA